MALSLARQGVTFRIIGKCALLSGIGSSQIRRPHLLNQTPADRFSDKEEAPLLAGRADALHPRSLEILHSWGLAHEFTEEGPILDHTAMYKNGEKMIYSRAYQSDSRYRGTHIITQAQIEKIYIRDILRHKVLVERSTIVDKFAVESDSLTAYPVRAILKNIKTGKPQTVKAKFLIGAEGAASGIRKQLGIPFDGVTTDIHWGITDCKFETDYPYITTFG